MEQMYTQEYQITPGDTDGFGFLRPGAMLYLAQEMAGSHCKLLGLDQENMDSRGLFWAVSRHKVKISRLPRVGETVLLQTWPMPTTRVAYPRILQATDKNGEELFQVLSLWVLMDRQTRVMVLPGKSGVEVAGSLRGNEMQPPLGLPAKELPQLLLRQVKPEDLDRNGHMNNTRYLDWVCDLLPGDFWQTNTLAECTACYLAEALEGQQLMLSWGFLQEKLLQVDIHREGSRIFSARLQFGE